ncbi:MAG: hypothetical protein QCI38_01720, partial [Candidatus Thermoplasmatota archaeon]|nr:hypothetical protein [Candidatus Thermoplasmatota archaeon]
VKNFSDPLVFIDPVDGNRNVAAAVTVQKKALLSYASRCYIEKPSELFFFPNPPAKMAITEAESILNHRGTKLLLATTPHPKGLVPDVLFPQFNKMHKVLVERCGQEGFPVVSSMAEAHGDGLYILLELERDQRSPVFKHLGPPVWSDQSQNFLDRWKEEGAALVPPYIDEGRWVVLAPRAMVKAAEIVFDGLTKWGIGKDLGILASEVKIEVYSGREALEKAGTPVLSSFFDKRFPWERK